MIDVIGVANPTGNHSIATVAEMAMAKFFKSDFAGNKMKDAMVQAFFQNL